MHRIIILKFIIVSLLYFLNSLYSDTQILGKRSIKQSNKIAIKLCFKSCQDPGNFLAIRVY
jgi:hypothetical protein